MKYTGKAQNQVTGQEWTTRAYDSYEAAHKAAEKLAGRHIPAGNVYIYVEEECSHRQGTGAATEEDMERYKPGDECGACGCTLGTDGYWYVERNQAPGYPEF